MLDWLIIGGGIQGTHLALALVEDGGVPRENLRILDPHPLLGERWRQLAENTGMAYLRSPMVHHLGPREFPLDRFVRMDEGRPYRSFIPPYNRPSTRLFNAHSLTVVKRYRLENLHLPTRASGLHRTPDGWRVRTPQGEIESRRVLLAFGHTEQPHWPDWASRLHAAEKPVFHIFDDHFRRKDMRRWNRVLIVGGGLSAVTLAVALASAGGGRVTLISRSPVRVEQFDSDPGWLGPKLLAGFQAEPDYTRRRALIDDARNRGTIPPDMDAELRRAIREERLERLEGEITLGGDAPEGEVELRVNGQPVRGDRVILATGFNRKRPGGPWLDNAVREMDLPVAPCGFPILRPDLSWAEGLYAAGAFAELELGPTARNIAGARNAADRLIKTQESR